jgi:hypothetical protein
MLGDRVIVMILGFSPTASIGAKAPRAVTSSNDPTLKGRVTETANDDWASLTPASMLGKE